jgi:hypothetical protein
VHGKLCCKTGETCRSTDHVRNAESWWHTACLCDSVLRRVSGVRIAPGERFLAGEVFSPSHRLTFLRNEEELADNLHASFTWLHMQILKCVKKRSGLEISCLLRVCRFESDLRQSVIQESAPIIFGVGFCLCYICVTLRSSHRGE